MTASPAADEETAPETPAPAPPARPRFLARLARHGYGVLALVCVVLWLPGVVSLPALDRDESRFAESSRQMLDTGNYVDIRFGQVPRYKKPVGIYWLQAAATAAVGFIDGDHPDHTHIWTYRLPSLFDGIIAVWLTFWCGSLFGAETGLVAGLLLAATLLLTAEATMATTDAALLAAVTAMQGVLLRVYQAAKEDLPPLSRKLVLAGWAALAVGILLKGPVAPGVAAATVIGLLGWDWFIAYQALKPAAPPPQPEPEKSAKPAKPAPAAAAKTAAAPEPAAPAAPETPPAPVPKPRRFPPLDFHWLARTRPLTGIALAVLLVAPWLVAISLQSHGAFLQQSLGGDFAAKVAGEQEGHGAPPGSYLLIAALTFWPAILFLLPGIGLGLLRRAEASVRFLIAWMAGWWLVVEAVPTKLPNYVLPAAPALAVLGALWLLMPGKDEGWRRVLPFIAALQFFLGLCVITAAPWWLSSSYAAAPLGWPLVTASILACLLGLTALVIMLKGRRLPALAFALAAAFIIIPALTAVMAPSLGQLWMTTRLAALVAKDRQNFDPPPILAGYEEPSMLFALGADIRLSDGKGAAELGADHGGLALVDDAERPDFLARLAELQATADALDDVAGYNYSRGRPEHVTLYRVAPLTPQTHPLSH